MINIHIETVKDTNNTAMLKIALLVVGVAYVCNAAEGVKIHCPITRMPGGLGIYKKPDDVSQRVVQAVIDDVAARLGNVLILKWKVRKYRTQVVAGVNYYLKLKVKYAGDIHFIHIKVFQSLDQKYTLQAVAPGMPRSGCIEATDFE
ncbi:unnamed protein product [Owenia fusiformis]|uniref:Cystatin domain-containing protein n=1 Tax=Owenia fusiformis TaxID=6347 RepID=A0A8S4NRK5_OWEFU|nr:unnamed protein product [Owenia fusiformis]